jgi:hypothetical protein
MQGSIMTGAQSYDKAGYIPLAASALLKREFIFGPNDDKMLTRANPRNRRR